MNLDALTEFACWFHVTDHSTTNHTNYVRWIPVDLKDKAELPETHPEVAKHFQELRFTVHKSKNTSSSTVIGQVHEQNISCT